jgi:REP element-mobilizing transposase RayT
MNLSERKRLRLKGYDYTSAGAYFVTICVHRQFRHFNIFGKIEDHKMKLNKYGEIVSACWTDLANHYFNIELDEYIIMPDHVHGIIQIINDGIPNDRIFNDVVRNHDNVGNGFKPFPTMLKPDHAPSSEPFHTSSSGIKKHGLPEIIRGFKTFSSRRIDESKFKQRFQWQKSYYDTIIRNKITLYTIRQYIKNNPKNADMCGYIT